MVSLARFFGRTVGEGAGVAIGTATGTGVEPAVQQLANTMQEHFKHRPLEPEDAAALVARETIGTPADGDGYYPGIDLGPVNPEKEALYGGIRESRFRRLVALAREHPSISELLTLRRRRIALEGTHGIGRNEYREWLRRQGFTTEVIDALTKLLTNFLSPADIANAVQQGFVPGDGILPPPPGGRPPFEPPVEEVPLDTKGVFKTSGMSVDDLKVLAQLSGNPPGPETLLELWNRGAITETAVERGIREGRTKTKWTPALKELAKRLLSPATIVNLYLRGWITEDAYHRRMKLHGYDQDKADDWYKSAGRPMAPVQAFTAFFRGAPSPLRRKRDGTPADFNKADFIEAIRRSDIRPEYGDTLWALRYAYPSLFQLRGAVQAGFLTRERALTILKYERYEDIDATALVDGWLRGSGTTGKGLTRTDLETEYRGGFLDPNDYADALIELGYSPEAARDIVHLQDAKLVRQARDAAVRTIRSLYVRHRLSYAEAQAAIIREGVTDPAAERVLAEWGHERELTADALTAAQVKKAWKKALMTRPVAIDRLEHLGYEPSDANIYLDE